MFIFCDINTSVKLWDIQKAKKNTLIRLVFLLRFSHNFPRVYITISRVFISQLPACL